MAALKVSVDLTLDQWHVWIHETQPVICEDVGAMRKGSLDGGAADVWSTSCSSESLDTIKAVALHDAHGYVLVFAAPTTAGLESDSAAFDAVTQTFRLGS